MTGLEQRHAPTAVCDMDLGEWFGWCDSCRWTGRHHETQAEADRDCDRHVGGRA